MKRLAIIALTVVAVAAATACTEVTTTKNITELSDTNTTLTVKTGTLLRYTAGEHNSVGIFSEYAISNEGPVTLIENKQVYLQPERIKQGSLGADEAKRIYTLQAKEKGTSIVTFRQNYRGKIESEVKFTITVE